VADQQVVVGAHGRNSVDIPVSGTLQIRTLSRSDEVIEEFAQPLSGSNATYVYNVAGAAPLTEWTAVYTPEGKPRGADFKGPAERMLGAPRWTTTDVDFLFSEPPERLQTDDSRERTYRTVLSAASGEPAWRQAEMIENEQERAQLVLTHARWDDTGTANTAEWMLLASTDPQFPGLLAERVRRAPNDVVLLRLEQDTTKDEAHAEACNRHRALAQKKPAESNLQYLSIRCLEDPGQRNAAFVESQAKWPDNPWLAMAAGATLAERGEYARAQPMIDQAIKKLPTMRERMSLDAARLRRLNAEDALPDLGSLVRFSSTIGMLTSIESGDGLEGTPLAPYAELARGRIREASELARAMPEGRERALRIVATSDGATPAMIKEALDLPVDDGSDYQSLIPVYALALRAQRDTAPYSAQLNKQLGEDGDSVVEYLERVEREGDNSAAYANLPRGSLSLRLHALHAALLLQGDVAPRAWRREVARGLFVGERGYLRNQGDTQ
jgi:hypothetical protein